MEAKSSPFFCLFVLSGRSMDWVMPTHTDEGTPSLLGLLTQMLTSSRNTPSNTIWNNVPSAIWASLSPGKLPHKIHHHSPMPYEGARTVSDHAGTPWWNRDKKQLDQRFTTLTVHQTDHDPEGEGLYFYMLMPGLHSRESEVRHQLLELCDPRWFNVQPAWRTSGPDQHSSKYCLQTVSITIIGDAWEDGNFCLHSQKSKRIGITGARVQESAYS